MKQNILTCLVIMMAFCSCREQDDSRLLSKLDAVLQDKAVYEIYFEDAVRNIE